MPTLEENIEELKKAFRSGARFYIKRTDEEVKTIEALLEILLQGEKVRMELPARGDDDGAQ